MTRVAVLGAGLVGRVLARDLASDPELEVLAVDSSEAALREIGGFPGIETRATDLSNPDEMGRAATEADVVVGALPGRLGASLQRAVIEAGRPLVDISFTPEDPLALDGLARRHKVPVVVDCGVAPGLSNLFAGCSSAEMERVETVLIYVGGLPLRRVWPYEYRIVFSPTDVIEEYLRPSRFRENGEEVVRPALSDVELLDFPRAGTLEAFNTDGLRTLLGTIPAPTLKEKTLRYPGHAERMRMLRETGFFDSEPVEVGKTRIAPRELTERLLFRAWQPVEGEEEFTLLRVIVEGLRGKRRVRTTWDLFDRTDPASGTSSMARTTAFPCAIVARLLARGRWTRAGVHAPEILGRDREVVDLILEELAARGIQISRQETTLS